MALDRPSDGPLMAFDGLQLTTKGPLMDFYGLSLTSDGPLMAFDGPLMVISW